MEEFSFGLFDDLLEETPLPEIEDEQSYKQKLKSVPNIYSAVHGEIRFSRALYSGTSFEINALLDVYQDDFDKVKDFLVKKYGWNADDKFWLKKTVLVASTEEECQRAKSLENLQIDAEDLRRAVIVLLLHPVDGEKVAVLHPNETNRSAVAKLINALIPNGLLSWNLFDVHGNKETIMEIAASRGFNYVIERLYTIGVEIAANIHNPLLHAISHTRKNTVRWLLSEHFDHFDCTLRDSGENNALICAILGSSPDLFDFVLDKMITYRKKFFNETDEEAFREIFRLEHKDYDFSFILTYVKKTGQIFQKLEQAIQKYNLKLSHQWSHYVVLGRLIEREIALNYCFEAIRKDPGLLGLKEEGTTTILQTILQCGHFEFVREMYTEHPEVKSYFNTESAFGLLKNAIIEQNCTLVKFAFEHHEAFLKSDLDKLNDHAVRCQGYTYEFYETRYDLLKECFPEFLESIDELRKLPEADIDTYNYGVEGSFSKADICDLNNLSKPYSTVRGSNRETLLHLAVERDDKGLFIRMLEAGCEFDAVDNDGNHPVHLLKSVEMLDSIIDRHPEGRNIIHRTNNEGCTVLHNVCQQYAARELLEKIIEYGANVHQLTKTGESAVFFVRDCQMFDVLREHEVQLDTTNNKGETALEKKIHNNHFNISIELFRYVHDLPSFKAHAHKYLTSMLESNDYETLFKEHPKAARTMVDSLYENSREEASRLFCKACGIGFLYVVELFLDGNYDLDFNYKDTYGNTPLHGVISSIEPASAPRLIERLLEKRVNLLARDQWGRDALMTLVERYPSTKLDGLGLDALQLLLDHGASIGTVDQDGNTPLHFAFQERELELIEFLIKNGIDVDTKNKQGKRPIEMAPALYQELFYFYSNESYERDPKETKN